MATTPRTTVVVLGAGASVAEALRHRPKQQSDHPPLDGNFFQRVSKHALPRSLARVIKRAEELGEPDLCGSSSPVSLEAHLGRLYFEMETNRGEKHADDYYDLIDLYADELIATTSWMARRSGPIRDVLEAEMRSGRRLVVITFNHDLLIENALSMIPSRRYGHVWCMEHAYEFAEIHSTVATTGLDVFDYSCPGSRHEHVPIFKLHGSLNWVFRTLRKHPPRDVGSGKRELFVWRNRKLVEHNRRLSTSGRDWYLWSLIVPPIYEKHGFIRNELRQVWDAAAEVLRGADRVVFWGYSFPRADLHARYFFQHAAHANPALTSPVLINPDPESHKELWTVLKPKAVEHYRDVAAFLSRSSA